MPIVMKIYILDISIYNIDVKAETTYAATVRAIYASTGESESKQCVVSSSVTSFVYWV